MGKNSLNATDADFDSAVMKSPQLCVVDFWAEWCGPCKQLGPKIDEIAEELQGKVRVFKMNVDENPKIPSSFGIRSIPTILFFKNGKVVDQVVGNRGKDELLGVIQKHLA